MMKSSISTRGENIIKRHGYGKRNSSRAHPTRIRELRSARPPVEATNLNGPSFFSYNVPKDPPMMTSFPAFTFRPKTQTDRDGGQQRAWGKEWFAHNHVWLQKADFDPRLSWPAPTDHVVQSGIGKSTPFQPRSSSYSFGGRRELKWVKKDAANEPGPGSYTPEDGKDRLLLRPKMINIQKGYREGNYLWRETHGTPGPGTYDPKNKIKKFSPGFTFSQSRRTLDYSPPCTL